MFNEREVVFLNADGEEVNAFDYLMADGNLGVPGGAYGSDTRDCAAVACLLFEIQCRAIGGERHADALDGIMSAVVNSSEEVVYSIVSGIYEITLDESEQDFIIRAFLGDDARELAAEYESWAY